MTSSDDLQFLLDTDFFLFLDPSETFNALMACPENPSLLASEDVHNEIVEYPSTLIENPPTDQETLTTNLSFCPEMVPQYQSFHHQNDYSRSFNAVENFPGMVQPPCTFSNGQRETNDIHPSTLIENPHTDQETITRNSSFVPEMVLQHQSFHHRDHYSRSFNAVEKFPGMPPCTFQCGQRESGYSENCLLTSTNKVMTTEFQSTDVQHAFVNQSYQQPSLPQTIPNFSNEPYVSTLKMESNAQQVGRTNGPTNHNPMSQDHRIHPFFPCRFQEERYDDDLLLAKLKHSHENDQMHRPEPSNISKPPYVGARLSNQHQILCASSRNTIPNPENRTPMISYTHTPKTSESYSPFAQTYQSDPYAFNFQTSSSLQTTYTRRPRGRPRKNLISIPLVPTTQTPLTSLRHYGAQDKGKEHITAIPSMNPTLYNQYQNSYTNIMTPQSEVLRQHSCNDQLENESSSSKTRRTMGTFQEKSIADSSTCSFWQNENTRLGAGYAAKHHHDKRSIQNAAYDPLYAAYGMPLDPHLRAI
ncbi:uncharacterized protein LOC103829351 isoform X2 [Brassica rapa]|uniref:uncharacterized protein LOC103829351 isoform X2 n=1 Tax=Brassica campestris TaxID=3711 RepID=UPI00142E7A2B|nr:uncharacterized protein LOC103829351 isoform X2 [Brassica rapa]